MGRYKGLEKLARVYDLSTGRKFLGIGLSYGVARPTAHFVQKKIDKALYRKAVDLHRKGSLEELTKFYKSMGVRKIGNSSVERVLKKMKRKGSINIPIELNDRIDFKSRLGGTLAGIGVLGVGGLLTYLYDKRQRGKEANP